VTALCVVCKQDHVTLITDGACVEAGGRLAMVAPKVFLLPHLSAALAIVGPTALIPKLGAMFSIPETFDDLLAEAPAMARVAYDALGDMKDFGDEARDFELSLVGFSETRNRAESYLIRGHERDRLPSWELSVADNIIVTPLPLHYEWPEAFDPLTDGLVLIEAQRRVIGPLGHVIGGFAQVTTITRASIETKIIRRWPDVVGEKITPMQ